jgi:hypothetical protein
VCVDRSTLIPGATISNRDLSVGDDRWYCQPLERIEATARTAYYVTRLLRYLEAL